MDSTSTTYRAELDGLRGLAVAAVVLFHARAPGFSGGFVGVDVFFVISGYLITRLILNETANGRFSLTGFYERRLRRIMPALLVMLAASSLAAWILLPMDLRRYGASLFSVTGFLSNLLFWRWSDYFGLAEGTTPLLHTWSLAIEEQLYVVFPLALLLLGRMGRRTTGVIIGLIAAGSFAYSVRAAGIDRDLAFYSPLSRVWEFLVGALLAMGALPRPVVRWRGDALAGLGLAAIAFAVLRLSGTTPFPGVQALFPCLGAALVIHGARAPGSLVARLLGAPPLVTLGLASYSLYLWHWPMMVFGTYYILDDRLASLIRLAMAGAAVPLALLSWRYVERPFRGPHGFLSRRALFGWTLALSAVLAMTGAAIYALDGLPGRFDATVRRLAATPGKAGYPCANLSLERLGTDPACILGDATKPPTFVLWGDSHAAMHHPGLDALARRSGVTGYSLTAFACPPLLTLRGDGERTRSCRARNEQVMALIAARRPRAVILAARWTTYFGGSQAARADGAGRTAPAKHDPGYSPQEARLMLEHTVAALRRLGVTVYFVEDVSVTRWSADRLGKARVLGSRTLPVSGSADHARRDAGVAALAAALEQRGMVRVLRPARELCDAGACRVIENGEPLYFDGTHLSPAGARAVSAAFEPVMVELQSTDRREDRPQVRR